MNLEIGPVGITAMILGVTEALKNIFGIEGKWNQVVAIATGMILTSIAYGINNQLIPTEYVAYIQWAIISFCGGLSAIGVFDFAKKELPKMLASFVDNLE